MKKPPDKYKCIKLPITSILNKNEESQNIFNTIQEKLINGGFTYVNVESTKLRKARKIKNFQQDMKINSELFELAMEYAN